MNVLNAEGFYHHNKKNLGDFSAQFPMSDVSSDLFSIGQNYYLVLVDRYSGYPFCAKLKNITAASVIKQLYTWFTDYGWPVTMKSDQGTQGFLTQDLFHSTSLATWGSSGASKEAKFFKELTFFSFVRYFSAKIEQSSKMSKTELKNAHLGWIWKFTQFWLKSSA